MSDHRVAALIALVLSFGAAPVAAQLPAPKVFAPPAPTSWLPVGCRGVSATDAVLPPRTGWHNLHADSICSDEVSRALAPVMREDWTAEGATYNPTGPVFDSAWNLYFSPFIPYENVVLISLDPTDGSRRWSIAGTGAPPGGSAPMILADPSNPGAEIVYLALYDRALAVRTDGTIVWDAPTGLTLGPNPLDHTVLGVNYLLSRDAIVALTTDGFIYAVDRLTGAPLLSAPYRLPGERSPAVPSTLPPAVIQLADAQFRQFVNLPAGSLPQFTAALLGNNVEVANMFAIDPRSGRLWVAATAPDAEDGTVDGLSSLGALYGLDVVDGTAGDVIVEACHRSFAGGSASTPTLRADGTRIYLGDNFGKLLAIDDSCNDVWEVDLGSQIFGSVAVSADNREVYASTQLGISKVTDEGAVGALVWTANLDVFDLAPGQQNLNMNLVAIGANGLAFQAGAGVILNNVSIPSLVGVGALDRDTGAVRYFAGGGEETVAVMSTGPDGVLYIGNSPVRRLFGFVLGLSPAPLRGGITKFVPQRFDLLMRDAACAGEARALNAWENQALCPDAAAADIVQIRELIEQIRAASGRAIADGNLTAWRWRHFDRRLNRAEKRLDEAEATLPTGRRLRRAGLHLRRVCRVLSK